MKFKASHNHERGQSLIEFAFLIPILFVMVMILVQVQTAISMAIVNQKYARQLLHYLSFNHRQYPEVGRLKLKSGKYGQRFWVGVDDKINFGAPSTLQPRAPTQKIGNQTPPSDDEPGPVERRQNVRIRITAFTCVPPVGARVGELFSEGHLAEGTFGGGMYRYCEREQ